MWPGGGLGQQNFALMPSWRRHSWLYPEAALQQLLFAEFLLFSVALRGRRSQWCAEDGCVFTEGCKQRFFCHCSKRYCKLQQPYYLLVSLALSLGEVALVTCQKIDARRGGLVLIIYRRSCSMLKRCLEKKFVWEFFSERWKSRRLFKNLLWITYQGQNILWFLDWAISIVINTRLGLI